MLNQIGEVEELIVEATNHIEHQRSIPNGLTKIRQLVSDGLEAAEIFGDGEVPLHESVKLGVEDHGAVFLIADKLLLETLPDKACSGKAVSSFGAHLVDLRCDGAVEPRQDSAVEAAPWDVVGVVIFTKDVIRKSVALQCIKEEAAPPIVLGEAEFKGDGHQGFDIEDPHGLDMQGCRGDGDLGDVLRNACIISTARGLEASCTFVLSLVALPPLGALLLGERPRGAPRG